MSNIKRYEYCGNPFFLYSISWILVLGLYQLHWTDLYPMLSLDTVSFLLVTSFISLVLAIKYNKRCIYKRIENPDRYYRQIKKFTKIAFSLLVMECLYCRTIPFLSYILGRSDFGLYKEFGIPFIHVLVVNITTLLFYLSSYIYLFSNRKGNRYKKLMILLLLSPLIYMNRATFFYMLFGLGLMFLQRSKHRVKNFFIIILTSIGFLYLFGLTGNIRNGDSTNDYIMTIGGATEEFRESIVPKEFFWSYVYLVTPIGNLQNAINKKKKFSEDTSGADVVFIHQIIPQFISKRLGVKKENFENYLVVPHLTVGTTYYGAYIIWGWGGMWMVYFAMMLYTVFMLAFVPCNSLVHVPLLCLLSTMLFFSLFDNMIIFMGLFPQLVLIFIMRNIRINNEKNCCINSYV